MGTLDELALKYKADKGSKWHRYTPMYECWLSSRDVTSLLEIGFGSGASPRMWREYFPNAKIYIMEKFAEEFEKTWHSPDTHIEGVEIIKGDATTPEAWAQVPQDISVIIDDGSHKPEEQIATFLLGLPKVCPWGLYFIEDIYNNFNRNISPEDLLLPWLNALIENQQDPSESAREVESLDFYNNRKYMTYPTTEIYSYHIYKNVLMFEKA